MSEELVIRGKRGDFNDYEKFISKFKAAKTTDDCYTPQLYNVGDRIAQLIIIPYPEIEFVEVDTLADSDRGEGGYGSSGE